MQVKFFTRIGPRGSYSADDHMGLEHEVNSWLEHHPDIHVIDIKQCASGGSWSRPQVFITVIYE